MFATQFGFPQFQSNNSDKCGTSSVSDFMGFFFKPLFVVQADNLRVTGCSFDVDVASIKSFPTVADSHEVQLNQKWKLLQWQILWQSGSCFENFMIFIFSACGFFIKSLCQRSWAQQNLWQCSCRLQLHDYEDTQVEDPAIEQEI